MLHVRKTRDESDTTALYCGRNPYATENITFDRADHYAFGKNSPKPLCQTCVKAITAERRRRLSLPPLQSVQTCTGARRSGIGWPRATTRRRTDCAPPARRSA